MTLLTTKLVNHICATQLTSEISVATSFKMICVIWSTTDLSTEFCATRYTTGEVANQVVSMIGFTDFLNQSNNS